MNKIELEQLLSLTVWKQIDGYENYEVSICGQVRNVKTKRILKPGLRKGYYRVDLSKDNKPKRHSVHRLVCKAFIPNLENCNSVDHINNIRTDNTISNLRWCTNQQNSFNNSLSKRSKSGIKGVTWFKSMNKWRADICINNKVIYLGCFDTLEQAKNARQFKAKEIFGEFLNEIEK